MCGDAIGGCKGSDGGGTLDHNGFLHHTGSYALCLHTLVLILPLLLHPNFEPMQGKTWPRTRYPRRSCTPRWQLQGSDNAPFFSGQVLTHRKWACQLGGWARDPGWQTGLVPASLGSVRGHEPSAQTAGACKHTATSAYNIQSWISNRPLPCTLRGQRAYNLSYTKPCTKQCKHQVDFSTFVKRANTPIWHMRAVT